MFPGVILAGGNARRLGGKGKALIKINGFPLINLVLQKFESQVSKVAINTRAVSYTHLTLPTKA